MCGQAGQEGWAGDYPFDLIAAPPPTFNPTPGLERFANVPDEERLAELETLRDYLKVGPVCKHNGSPV